MRIFRMLFCLTQLCLIGACPVQANESNQGSDAIWQLELRSYLKKLPKNVSAYHWTTHTRMGLGERSMSEVKHRYVENSLKAFARMEKDSQQSAGPGLYLATDPAATQFYGGTREWALLKLELIEGSRYLDLKDEGLSPFSTRALAELQKGNCHPPDALELFNQANCRPYVHQARKELQFAFITYTYTTTQFEGMKTREEQSILLSSSEAVDWQASSIFTAQTKGLDQERALIRKSILLSATARKSPFHFHAEVIEKNDFLERILPYSDAPKMPQADFIRFAETHFLN